MKKNVAIIILISMTLLIVFLISKNENDQDLQEDLMIIKMSDWDSTWESVYKSEGILSDQQIEEINLLLQPTFSNNENLVVNPVSCFFTSYYQDVRDINLTDFLRYCPIGEIPEELPEFEALAQHENWPFGKFKNVKSLPVPIHRYKSELVQELFTLYAGINLDELTGVGFDEVIYLNSTDAYYNYTSDFAPGFFKCTEGIVEDDVIKLYSDSRHTVELIIAKIDGKYVIKSFNAK
jgi:hypothetical protein